MLWPCCSLHCAWSARQTPPYLKAFWLLHACLNFCTVLYVQRFLQNRVCSRWNPPFYLFFLQIHVEKCSSWTVDCYDFRLCCSLPVLNPFVCELVEMLHKKTAGAGLTCDLIPVCTEQQNCLLSLGKSLPLMEEQSSFLSLCKVNRMWTRVSTVRHYSWSWRAFVCLLVFCV